MTNENNHSVTKYEAGDLSLHVLGAAIIVGHHQARSVAAAPIPVINHDIIKILFINNCPQTCKFEQ